MAELEYSSRPVAQPSSGLEPGVRAARVRAGLTQREVADRLQVPIDTFRRWDRGTSRPRSPQRQRHLAGVLGASLEMLFPTDADPHVAAAMRTLESSPPTGREVGERDAGEISDLAAASCARLRVETDAPDGRFGGSDDRRSTLGVAEPTTFDGAAPRGLRPVARVDADVDPVGRTTADSEAQSDAARNRRSDGGTLAPEAAEPRPVDGARPVEGVRTVDGFVGDRRRRGGLAVPARARRVRATFGAAAVVLVVGLGVVLAPPGGEPATEPVDHARRTAGDGARAVQARRIDVAQQRGDFDLVMSLASASGDRASYDGARRAAADLLLDRAGDALKVGRLRTARRLVERVERRYGDPRPSRRASLTDRIAAARKAARAAERRRARAAQRERRSTPAAATSASSGTSTPAATTETPAASSSSSGSSSSSSSGGDSSSTRRSSDSERSPEFF